MACMKGKNKRKHTNGFNEDRLMLISWAAPVLAQLVMLVVMIAQRQWLYVAMLGPGAYRQRDVVGIHGIAVPSETAV